MEPFTKTMELVARAQQGDAGALDRICRRYYERIRIPVRFQLGKRLRQKLDSNDILQEVFVGLIRDGLQGFEMRDEGSLLRYLTRRAVHAICAQADWLQAERRNPDREVPLEMRREDGGSEPRPALHADTAPIVEKLVASEHGRILEECLEQLDEHHREVILLRDFLGLSWQQIQEELGLNSINAARERRRTALVRLSDLLRRRGVHEDRE